MSSFWPRWLATLVACLALVHPARGQDEDQGDLVLVEITTTASSGRNVYIDKGRDDGLEPGDRVRFLVPGESAVLGEVRSVSSRSARVGLFGEASVDLGVRGEARIPAKRLEALKAATPSTEEPTAAAVQHPPWSRPPREWDQQLPLLAPLEEIEPADRETRVLGRAYAQVDQVWDGESDGADSLYSRIGTDLRIENPFERGGLLQIDAELARRMVTSSGAGDETQEKARVQRLSYAQGGTRYDPTRYEVGRFLQSALPEFGLLDGAEVSQFVDSSTYVGASAGWLVSPTFELESGDDVSVAAYVVRDLGPRRNLGWRLGYQKTWHKGSPDRDLVTTGINWRPSNEFSLQGSAMMDIYTSGEQVQDSGVELTELHLYANWRPSRKTGVSANLNRVHWPDLKRDEIVPPPGSEPTDPFSQRTSLRLWRELSREVRLTGRGDLWRNDQDNGAGAELRVDWRELLWESGRVSARIFANDGQYSSIEGLGLDIDRSGTSGRWALGYEISNSTQDDFQGTQQELLRHALRASWDTRLGESWSLSVYADQIFGDNQDALTLGVYLQQSF